MCEITEKLESMTWRAVKVCTKTGIGKKAGHQKPCYYRNFHKKLPRKRKFLIVQINFVRIIDVVGENYIVLSPRGRRKKGS